MNEFPEPTQRISQAQRIRFSKKSGIVFGTFFFLFMCGIFYIVFAGFGTSDFTNQAIKICAEHDMKFVDFLPRVHNAFLCSSANSDELHLFKLDNK